MIITSKARPVEISDYTNTTTIKHIVPPKQQQHIGPISWQLTVGLTELGITGEKSLRVHGDTHIGGVIYQLVESGYLPVGKHDWSGYALWWPQQNRWLNRNKQTLDQCGVQADARLQFIRTHRSLKIQLPDLQVNCYIIISILCFF